MNNQNGTQAGPLLSLVIAVYKKPEFLEMVLLSCLNQTFREFEILIADDGSGDEIRSLLERFRGKFSYPIVHCWHEDDGFRKTIIVNKSVLRAQAEYIIFIDGDCILHHKFLESHWKYKKSNTILSGRRVRLGEKITGELTSDDIRSRKIEKVSFWVKKCITKDVKHGIYLPLFYYLENCFRVKSWRILGCNFSMFKADFLSINGYDQRIIGRGMEDSNLNERALLKGIIIRSVVREALQYHLFHKFDPIPHSKEAIKEFCNPGNSWTAFGIVKKDAEKQGYYSND
jgi:glycosyltransferase involved in cell wall biosynthesis